MSIFTFNNCKLYSYTLLRIWLYILFVLNYAGELYPQPYSGQVRLVGGEFPSEGRLEVYFRGQWGAVCAEGTLVANVSITVCNQLGYSGATTSIPARFQKCLMNLKGFLLHYIYICESGFNLD